MKNLQSATALMLCLTAVVILAVPSSVASQTTADAHQDDEARGLSQAGTASFAAGRFEDAMRYFQQSYALSHRPALLFNIGQAADRARQDDVALEAFRGYLAAMPEDPNRDEIEGRVRVLEAAIEREHRAASGTPSPTPGAPDASSPGPDATSPAAPELLSPLIPDSAPPTASPPSTPSVDVGGIALVSVGGASIIVGAILLAVGAPDVGALNTTDVGADYHEIATRESRGDALLGAGVAALGVGLVLAVVGAAILASGSDRETAHVRVTRDGLALIF